MYQRLKDWLYFQKRYSTKYLNESARYNKRKNKQRPLSYINEDQIQNCIMKEFIKAYMIGYSQRQVSDKELKMFMRYLKNEKPLNTSSNHYINRINSLCTEMKNYYSRFKYLNDILETSFDEPETSNKQG